MHSGSEHLLKHPRICMHCRFIDAIDRYIDNDRGGTVAALSRTTGCNPLHVLGKTLDVIRRMFHVVADVIGIRLRVFLSLLEAALRAGMRTGVINRLSLREQFDRSIDPLCLWSLGHRGGESQRCKGCEQRYTHEKPSHGFSSAIFESSEQYNYKLAKTQRSLLKIDCCSISRSVNPTALLESS